MNQLIDTTKPSTQMEISEEEYLAATSYIRLLLTKEFLIKLVRGPAIPVLLGQEG